MSNIYLLKKNLPKVFLIAVLFLTISASTVSAVKLAQSFTGSDDESIPEISVVNDVDNDDENESDDNDDGHFEQNGGEEVPEIEKPSSNIPEGPDLLGTTSQGVAPSSNADSCIITLFGEQYDVTSLRTTHSGGDVFNCGADNSSIYEGEHGTNVSRMQPYLVGNSGTVSGSGASNTTKSSSEDGEDEDDDEEEEYERQKKELEHEFEEAKKELEDAHENEDD